MRPGFALTLSEDGIGLLHRAKGGWQRIGDVSLDDPGLGETLRLMRGTAEGLARGKLHTKLVIPDSQVLYTTQPLRGETPAEKHASLLNGLDGLTPYAVDEIVFDWQETGDGRARLAVVARETLAEAEAFADQHAFNPVCCVAAPPADQFGGEAFFGPTSVAGRVLENGESPERDSAPVRPGAMADYAAGDEPAARPKPAGPAKASAGEADRPKAAPAKPAPAEPEPEPAETAPETPPAAPPDEDAPQDRTPPSFSTRRAGDAPAQSDDRSSATVPSRLTLGTEDGGTSDADPTPEQAPSATPSEAPEQAPSAAAPAAPKPVTPAPQPPRPQEAAPATASAPKLPPAPPPLTAHRPAAAPPKMPKPHPAATGRPPDNGEGMQGLAAALRRPSPGLLGGLVLSVLLLVAMAAIGLWSLGDDPGEIAATVPDATSPDSAAQPDTAATASAPGTPPSAPETPPAMAETAAIEAYASSGLWQRAPEPPAAPGQDRIEELFIAALEPGLRAPVAPPLPDPAATRAIDAELPQQANPPAANDIAARQPRPGADATPGGATEPVVADILPAPDEPGDAAAPAPQVVLGRPEITPPPRPTFVFPVTEGRPPAVPPARPAPNAAPAPEAAPAGDPASDAQTDTRPPAPPVDTAPATETAAAPAEPAPLPEGVVIAASPEIAARLTPFRPRLRPDGIAPAALAPAPDPAAQPGPRPLPRPLERVALPGAENGPEGPVEEDVAAAVAAALAANPLPANAIVRSIRPVSRPEDLAARVAATAPAVPQTATVRPSIPTTASVARQATVSNAINLRQLNLIGVYGSSSDRRALVRLPSGRYEKVKVGDRIDGGRVAAIGESDLRYVKNGRNIVLDLPGG
ncbi:hypothetical protein SAMN05444722_0537 [Rhodovulum sp. ES.010]|uniref:hypothetical protein n=1 Tax=Rhodovulum sp. ES.010 TaxID=1882821 RepID=UPI00092BD53B|nr:hypothetical protein [Rhodovulum sp. ES.010]SIO12946.1 hypothetical protein SAMN05444722_0537 [Rhodovulum sp. ES.010]